MKSKSFARDIGLTVQADKVLRIESKLESNQNIVLPTDQLRWAVGLVYRLNLGDKPEGITLKASVRYAALSFTIDKSMVPAGVPVGIPNVAYTYIEPGLSVRFPINDKVALGAGGHFYVVQGTGDIQLQDSYGGASVSGFDLGLLASYRLKQQILVQGAFRYARFGHSFDGTGVMTDLNSDGTPDVTAATDAYLGLYATAAYQF
jgi:hypothetical protein